MKQRWEKKPSYPSSTVVINLLHIKICLFCKCDLARNSVLLNDTGKTWYLCLPSKFFRASLHPGKTLPASLQILKCVTDAQLELNSNYKAIFFILPSSPSILLPIDCSISQYRKSCIFQQPTKFHPLLRQITWLSQNMLFFLFLKCS